LGRRVIKEKGKRDLDKKGGGLDKGGKLKWLSYSETTMSSKRGRGERRGPEKGK